MHINQWHDKKSNLNVPVHDSIFVQVLESNQYLLRVSSNDLLKELVVEIIWHIESSKHFDSVAKTYSLGESTKLPQQWWYGSTRNKLEQNI